MNCKFINVLMFAAGAAIGSAVTWKLIKTRYERIAQEEIESVKEAFSEYFTPNDGDESTTEVAGDTEEDPDMLAWEELDNPSINDDEEDEEDEEFDRNDYERIVNSYTSVKGGAAAMENAPRVISPYEFGELDEYYKVELTYYTDDVLEDEEYNIVNDRDELIGPGALNTFGDYEEDAVFVRNDRLKTDFQILKDYRTYEEARSVGPNKVDDE